jgi:hypothetical protein
MGAENGTQLRSDIAERTPPARVHVDAFEPAVLPGTSARQEQTDHLWRFRTRYRRRKDKRAARSTSAPRARTVASDSADLRGAYGVLGQIASDTRTRCKDDRPVNSCPRTNVPSRGFAHWLGANQ